MGLEWFLSNTKSENCAHLLEAFLETGCLKAGRCSKRAFQTRVLEFSSIFWGQTMKKTTNGNSFQRTVLCMEESSCKCLIKACQKAVLAIKPLKAVLNDFSILLKLMGLLFCFSPIKFVNEFFNFPVKSPKFFL